MKKETIEDIVCVILLLPLTLFISILIGGTEGAEINIRISVSTRIIGIVTFIGIIYLAYINYKHEK